MAFKHYLPDLKLATSIIRAANHKLRIQILEYLHINKNTTVTQVYVHFRLEQSVASQHLAILRKAGLVTATRQGKFIFYNTNPERLTEVHTYCQSIAGRKVLQDIASP